MITDCNIWLTLFAFDKFCGHLSFLVLFAWNFDTHFAFLCCPKYISQTYTHRPVVISLFLVRFIILNQIWPSFSKKFNLPKWAKNSYRENCLNPLCTQNYASFNLLYVKIVGSWKNTISLYTSILHNQVLASMWINYMNE